MVYKQKFAEMSNNNKQTTTTTTIYYEKRQITILHTHNYQGLFEVGSIYSCLHAQKEQKINSTKIETIQLSKEKEN